jgi:hypothetical protein
MKKPTTKKRTRKGKSVMNGGTHTEPPPPVANVLTEKQKEFESHLAANDLLKAALLKAEEDLKIAGMDKAKTLAKDLATAGRVDNARAAATCQEIKTAQDNARKIKENLHCVLEVLEAAIQWFEVENCHDALQVYLKRRWEITKGEEYKKWIQDKIKELEERCEESDLTSGRASLTAK